MSDYTKIQIWKLASRPKTLPAAITPVVVGSALAFFSSSFKLLPALSCFFGALLLQIAANLANDYYDYKKGTDPVERIGPMRVAASGLLAADELFRGLMLIILLSIINGLYLIWVGGIMILLIGVASIISLMAYSGLRVAYGYYGMGDVMVFIFFGLFAVNGTYFVQNGSIDEISLWGSLPSGFLITAILVVNNYRDIKTDNATGKRTLAVIMGQKNTRLYFISLLSLSYVVLLIFYLRLDFSIFIFLPLITVPLSYKVIKALYLDVDGPRLNKTLASTAKLGLIFSILFSIGILLS
ncbi:MAG: 1,4-dihydroxy-2-naphthoate polyprenyltransferase [Candidatus Heimdallarchaeota archaeon]|nr:1,4-dihydroxy-2-naphthoate polyprenyltransferase [Candidatus Heimdallarchaeota archaeon]